MENFDQRKWVQRYIASKSNRLYYYIEQKDITAVGFIPLSAIVSVSMMKTTAETKASSLNTAMEYSQIVDCMFHITTTNKIFYLIAKTRREAKRWVKLLSAWKDCFKNFFEKNMGGEDPAETKGTGPFVEPLQFIQQSEAN